ncbi:MBL fold metallo-hydrolase [Sulfitobacter mediterraneus]|uniref:MBL fold metallo-hydrolase n=1 Tax=Sulfitobacter mediterraneus TaxID=83219 RepID=UPI001933D1A0|nr:MBL fold metallo-hydrolase [Sulfitobacter mediterraneus]MBM1311801.1 MBL fold metallo-hydrolase [Sulfitobacter mediterraneus]MBM1315683.1 MBL fold metallo-hydrolase [Sulfitobacter mediterraneus]MBM1324044.1 MBL fold metallo-hydrolase [Sulfitobacter mediterraneus]MBM1327956.1 MBL fold metallo-hydrolase [Sulfitobacter mediterraneus]MBM1399304.1 MBL fold metallo-hydrolase [Sulfitobacter mediterraneus]
MAQMRITILGCGSSGGVPRLGGHWGACDPAEPKNRRSRCSALVERIGPEGTTSVLIDTSPDMRQQLLDAEVGRLDAVLYTHSHADHVHGLDDLRMLVINMRQRLPVWADEPTRAALLERFGYAFIRPEGSMYPPILDMHNIEGDVTIEGAGGTLTFTPFLVNHGGMDALGFKMNNVAYLPDVASIPDDVWPHLQGLRCWIVDALRRDPHPTHSHLNQTLDWIKDMAPQEAVLTNMHNDLDYQTLRGELPAHISPAYDGMTLNFEID